jgi:hypothetical protein
MDKVIRKYDLKDPAQYEDEKKFWNNASIEYKIEALENIRESYLKLVNINKDEISKGLRTVYRITKQK